jgi:hypothetical protein
MTCLYQYGAGIRTQRNAPFQWLYFAWNTYIHACFTPVVKFRNIRELTLQAARRQRWNQQWPDLSIVNTTRVYCATYGVIWRINSEHYT